MKHRYPKILPTKKQVLAYLRADIDAWKSSNRERDGMVRDPDALHAIRCTEMAILMIKDRGKRSGGKNG